MCGILGMTGKGGRAAIKRAASVFSYRGPDAFGEYEDGCIALGHNRLSIIDLDERANQPMESSDDTAVIVFNGEIYNFGSLREELEQEGFTFKTRSDTEVLLAAYQAWGVDCTLRIRGMYAFAIHDRERKELFLAADHAGMKPLYYTLRDGRLMFASAIRGLLELARSQEWEPEIDRDAVEEYFLLGYIMAPRTLYAGIERLMPGERITFEYGSGVIRRHERAPVPVSKSTLAEAVRHGVVSHLVADVPVGVFFSGGTDSSLIAAMLQREGIALKTFSIRIEGRTEDEPYFSAIAKHLNIQSHVYDFGLEEFLATYASVMGKIDEPLSDNSFLPTAFVSERAADHVKVVLSGEGGDELFFGYPRSLVLAQLDAAREREWSVVERLYLSLPDFKGKRRFFAYLFRSLRLPLAYYLLTMSPAQGYASASSWRAAKRRILDRGIAPAALDEELYLPNNLLRKTDLASMYASIEARLPLLDPGVITAARKEPRPEAGASLTKPSLKRLLSTFLPSELVYRKKSGFGMSMHRFFAEMPELREDLARAREALGGQKLLPARLPANENLIRQHANLAWAIIVLWHVLRNNDTEKP